jgi:NADPH:quinone reductase-like Zn-dependent oxidoreductase
LRAPQLGHVACARLAATTMARQAAVTGAGDAGSWDQSRGRAGGDLGVEDPRRPAADEVLLEVKAAGVGNWDEFVRSGACNVGARSPMALGVEAAGIVRAVGEAVIDWSPGDAVMTHPVPLRHQGTWAPWLIADAQLLAPKPAASSWEAAAAFPLPALTAEQVVTEALGIRAGEHFLVNGAGGVTGALLVSLGVLTGAEVIAMAGPSRRARVGALGARHVVDYHDPEWPDVVRAIAGGKGEDAAANAASGGTAGAIRAVADGGRLATITSDPPDAQGGITVFNVYVRADGQQPRKLAQQFADGRRRARPGDGWPRRRSCRALTLRLDRPR